MRSVLIGTQKGGVGKTSLVASLASLAARPQDGRRVLVIDGDQQANLSRRNYGVNEDSGRSWRRGRSGRSSNRGDDTRTHRGGD